MKKLAAKSNITFVEFCNISSVKYWRNQLDGSNVKNITNTSQLGGTRNAYTYGLFRFNSWLHDKIFQYNAIIQINKNLIQYHRTKTRLCGVDHLLSLKTHFDSNDADFIRLIKEYLSDISDTKKYANVKNATYSIKSFFRENECDFSFQFRNRLKRRCQNYQDPSLSLDNLKKILMANGIQPIEKAVFLCKFQRGLDSSTLADRFNFEAWECLVKHFGTDKPELWNVGKNTPVPISLIRVKTGFPHVGFLDADAVLSIREYLQKSRYNSKPQINGALFVDRKRRPITVNWISRRFHKLVANSGLRDDLKYKSQFTSHDLRDLLKSTLIDSGCRYDVADHVIGHRPRDSYEKQFALYPESIKYEFEKASKRLNILNLVNDSTT